MKYPTFICCLIMIAGCRPQEKPEIIEFTTYTKSVDSSISLNKMRVYYNFFFLVKNFSANKEVISTIDSFATNLLRTSHFSPNREEVRLWLYKETSKTNIESIRANPREVDRYSNQHDLVLGYTLLRDDFINKKNFENGEVVESNSGHATPPKIKIEKLQ